ncbi:UDP-N-acetylmuramate dehydrogenase [Stieleria varia]|uniref:UDP-N-acetylenolpyruvoylglucosamine reductase n=1 Tax=Stieleria varia TaxID=2528005 RepID=A0A5C6B4Y8_9BACT|nr:UDP-N-acetylmuramate dehydrogenase [Stieleria varia]TWU06346.1 UDP-N-acetylenolpyruvoylglucosamine reductase MurB [Stieleria varia]
MTIPDELLHVVRADEPLAPLVWLGIGGPARFLAEPVEIEQLKQIYQWAAEDGLSVKILGGGSNLLVREAGFDGIVVSLEAPATSGLAIEGNLLTVGAGARLSHAVIKAVGSGLGGLEHLVGIPGTVGGAVVGNASAGGRDIGSVVQCVRVLDPDGSIRTVSQAEAGFSHRKSALGGLSVLDVVFELEQRDIKLLTKRMQKLWIARNSALPVEHRRIAVPFVDPDGSPVRELIQNVGLAGIREGNVSLDHAQPNYLIAHAEATSDECLRLIERVREQVLLQTGIDLQLNLKIW